MNESALLELPGSWVWTRLGFGIEKPQINADERRLIVFDFESLFKVYSDREIVQTLTGQLKLINSLQTTSMWQREVHRPRNRTKMTRIARIFTDLRASASTVAPVDVAHTYGSRHTWRSAFLCLPSAFIRVHPRLIFNREMRERGALAG